MNVGPIVYRFGFTLISILFRAQVSALLCLSVLFNILLYYNLFYACVDFCTFLYCTAEFFFIPWELSTGVKK